MRASENFLENTEVSYWKCGLLARLGLITPEGALPICVSETNGGSPSTSGRWAKPSPSG